MPHATLSNGLQLCYESFGEGPPLVLIMGLGLQMIGWDPPFCQAIAEQGFRVLRFDNRDIGESSRLDHLPVPRLRQLLGRVLLGRPLRPPYSLDDLADDVVALLDAIELDRAHVVGASMGGMIAQMVAVRHPTRVRSLVSIMSTTGAKDVSRPTLTGLRALLTRPDPTRQGAQDRFANAMTILGGSRYPIPEADLRALAGEAWDRGPAPDAFWRQLAAIVAAGNRRRVLAGVRCPTLVIHGDADPLIPLAGGRDTSAVIPNARLEVIAGMGHTLPPGLQDRLTALIGAHAAQADALIG